MIFFTALRKELLEQWSSYRLLIVAAVLLFFGLLSPVTAKYTLEAIKLALPNGEEIAALLPLPSVNEAVEQYLGNLSQFGVVIALLVTMGTVAQEKDKGTAALMLAKPLPRGIFLLAKLVAIALTFAGQLRFGWSSVLLLHAYPLRGHGHRSVGSAQWADVPTCARLYRLDAAVQHTDQVACGRWRYGLRGNDRSGQCERCARDR